MRKFTRSKKDDKHRQAELFQCNFKSGVKTSTSYSQYQVWHRIYWKLQGYDIGNGRSEVPCIFFCLFVCFVARTVIKRDLFPASLFQHRLFCVSYTFKWHSLNYYVSIFPLKVSKDCIFIYKWQKQRSVMVFVSLFLCYVLSFDCLFSGLSQFSSHSLLCPPMPPVVVETTAVRILSGVWYYLWPCLVSRLWNAW